MRKQPGDRWLLVLSVGLGNEDEMPCPPGHNSRDRQIRTWDLSCESPRSYPLSHEFKFDPNASVTPCHTDEPRHPPDNRPNKNDHISVYLAQPNLECKFCQDECGCIAIPTPHWQFQGPSGWCRLTVGFMSEADIKQNSSLTTLITGRHETHSKLISPRVLLNLSVSYLSWSVTKL